MAEKYIVVTGGVISGIGKGVLAASIGRLLKEMGVDIQGIKVDPYLNVDAGTMNPNQHGEVFVTEDGYEADLDLGHYERFMGIHMHRENNMTAGQVYSSVILKEREGKYLGSTVQMVPHVTSEIKERIRSIHAEVLIIEIGGTVGDIEGEIFLEAIRELTLEAGRERFLFAHITFVPHIRTTEEFKTKPTQQSVQLLRRIGIQPDVIIARSETRVEPDELKKIALFGGVRHNMVVNIPDMDNVYKVPQFLYDHTLHLLISERLGLQLNGTFHWEIPSTFRPLKIGLIGKYLGMNDAYKSIDESVFLCGVEKPEMIDAQELESLEDKEILSRLSSFDALIIPGGFGKRGTEGKIRAIQYCRESALPVLGICMGMQLMVIEFARNRLGWKEANSTEFDPNTPYPLIAIMENQKGNKLIGGSMRLGGQIAPILGGTCLHEIFGGKTESFERHRHRYEVNYHPFRQLYRFPEDPEDEFRLTISSISDFVEAIEWSHHPFFIGVQFHPEFRSKAGDVHPLFHALISKAEERKRKKKEVPFRKNMV